MSKRTQSLREMFDDPDMPPIPRGKTYVLRDWWGDGWVVATRDLQYEKWVYYENWTDAIKEAFQ